jgi:pilus assembly protein CpaB
MKSLILIFIALGCGLVASIGISQVMNREGTGGLEMEQILVALADIDIGTKLDAQNVKLEDWPKAKIPDGAVRKLEEVKDKFANARFFKGEPLHQHKISDTLSNIANKVPAGYRAMPVKVEDDTVMKGISPGDRVDVMVFLKKNGMEITETGAFTILTNVRVFAINTNTERASDAKGETSNFKTISLLVKPEHARELAVAGAMGKIMLTLRRPDEKNDETAGESVTPIQDILSGRTKLATEPGSGPPTGTQPPPQQGFKSFVQETTKEEIEAAAVAWKMEVLTPSERKIFEWASDPKLLPTGETLLSSSSGSGSSPPPPPVLAPSSPRGPSSGPGLGPKDGKSPPRGGDGAPPVNQDAS